MSHVGSFKRFLILHSVPSGPTHQDAVKAVISSLSVDNLKTDLTALSSYNNRYYKATTGAQASNDLAAKLKTVRNRVIPQ